MADSTESSLRIAADPNTVLDVIADVERYPEWAGQMKAVSVLTEDEGGWPDQVEFTLDAGAIKDTYVLEYTWDVDEDGTGVASWTLLRANLLTVMDGSYTLSTDSDGTHVTYRLRVELKVPLPGLVKRPAERTLVDTALQELKKRVEG